MKAPAAIDEALWTRLEAEAVARARRARGTKDLGGVATLRVEWEEP